MIPRTAVQSKGWFAREHSLSRIVDAGAIQCELLPFETQSLTPRYPMYKFAFPSSQLHPLFHTIARRTAKKVRLNQIIGLLVIGTITCMVTRVEADWTYDFESPLPASFVFSTIGPPTGTFSGGIDNGVLRLRDPHNLQGGPPLGAIGRETSQVFQHARMSGVLNATGTSDDLLGLNLNATASAESMARESNSTRVASPCLKS